MGELPTPPGSIRAPNTQTGSRYLPAAWTLSSWPPVPFPATLYSLALALTSWGLQRPPLALRPPHSKADTGAVQREPGVHRSRPISHPCHPLLCIQPIGCSAPGLCPHCPLYLLRPLHHLTSSESRSGCSPQPCCFPQADHS